MKARISLPGKVSKKQQEVAKRLGRFLEEVTRISDEHMTDEVYWTHADKRIEQLGIPFDPEDYGTVDR